MQKPFEQTLSSDDRAAIFSALLAGLTYCGAVALVCVVFSFAGGHSSNDSPVASSDAIADFSRMPL